MRTNCIAGMALTLLLLSHSVVAEQEREIQDELGKYAIYPVVTVILHYSF